MPKSFAFATRKPPVPSARSDSVCCTFRVRLLSAVSVICISWTVVASPAPFICCVIEVVAASRRAAPELAMSARDCRPRASTL